MTILLQIIHYGLEYMENISSRSLRKTSYQRKLIQTKLFLNDKIDQNTNLAKLPSAKRIFWYSCKFFHSKIEK